MPLSHLDQEADAPEPCLLPRLLPGFLPPSRSVVDLLITYSGAALASPASLQVQAVAHARLASWVPPAQAQAQNFFPKYSHLAPPSTHTHIPQPTTHSHIHIPPHQPKHIQSIPPRPFPAPGQEPTCLSTHSHNGPVSRRAQYNLIAALFCTSPILLALTFVSRVPFFVHPALCLRCALVQEGITDLRQLNSLATPPP